MTYILVPIPPNLVRAAITLDEAYSLLEAADPRAPAVDDMDAIDIRLIARRWLATQVLHDGITCFVWSPSSGWFRIPREYWWKPDWTMFELVNRVGLNPQFDYEGVIDAPRDLARQDVVVWREAIEALIAINRKPSPAPSSSPSDRGGSAASPPPPFVTPTPRRDGQASKPGRPAGSGNYPDDPRIVEQFIKACDALVSWETGYLTRAIRARILEIGGGAMSDENKAKRIRRQVLAKRPDLAN